MLYHIRMTVDGELDDVLKLDLTEKEFEERILLPYKSGKKFTLTGKTIDPYKIKVIKIGMSRNDSSEYLPDIIEDLRNSLVGSTISPEWEFVERTRDVTDQYIIVPAGEEAMSAETMSTPSTKEEVSGDGRTVLVVYGRNEALRESAFNFLRSIGLKPLEWSDARKMTGEGSPYIGTILNAAFKNAQAIVVLISPDDEARLLPEFRTKDDLSLESELTPQPRPNVLFEAGMAIGRDESRTIIVEFGKCRPFSDVIGRHVIRMNNTPEKRNDLAQRLETAGCKVDTSGSDWLKAGDFVV